MSESSGQQDYVCYCILESCTDKLNKQYSWKVIEDYCFSKYAENCLHVIRWYQQFLYTEMK